ncbi:MAG: TetR/AcrR family transcriptional regulator [Kiloniellaceae bacterium]
MVELLEHDLHAARTGAAEAEPASPKRSAIVQAATRLFLEAGYGAVSMNAIAAAAGVSKRTVYSHFAGKDALFGAVMANVCAGVIGTRAPASLIEGPPRRVLSEYGRTFLTLIVSRRALAIFRIATYESGRFPELGEVFYRVGPQRWTGVLAAYLREQDRTGALRVPDPEAAAAQFLAMVKGPVHMRLTLGVGPRPGAGEIEAMVEAAVSAFLRGYRTGAAPH